MRSIIFWLCLTSFVLSMCNTEIKDSQDRAIFIRICTLSDSDTCPIYFFTRTNKEQLSSYLIDSLLEVNGKYFLGESDANYDFLKYIEKDTINLVLYE